MLSGAFAFRNANVAFSCFVTGAVTPLTIEKRDCSGFLRCGMLSHYTTMHINLVSH